MADFWEFFCRNTWKLCWGTIWKLYALQQVDRFHVSSVTLRNKRKVVFISIPKNVFGGPFGTCMLYNEWIDSM